MRTLRYKILIRPETDGTYTVIVSSLPGCLTFGYTIEEALEIAKEAIDVYIESLIARGKEIPILKRCRNYTATSTLLAEIVGSGIGILSSFNPSR